MTLRLDLRTVSRAMRIARRLTADHSPEGLSLFRELLASLMDSRQFLEVIEPWIVPVSESLATGNVFTFCQKLPAIVRTFGASGYRTEAVRVMATGAGLVPALTSELIEATGLVFSHPSSKAVPARVAAAAEELSSVGLDLLEAGSPEGITLIGAAHRVAPGVAFPIKEIRERIHDLQGRRPMSWQIADAQAVTDAAYDLHFSGRLDPAARVATLVPSGLPGTATDQLSNQLKPSPTPDPTPPSLATPHISE